MGTLVVDDTNTWKPHLDLAFLAATAPEPDTDAVDDE
jgi:hypothetical protein